jgi:hypothetical protein
MAWTGSVMILVHAGIHFNALIPWLAILMLLVNVASGLVGKYLLKKANESLKERRQVLLATGITDEEVDKKLFYDSITVDVMKNWRAVHIPFSLMLVILTLIHVITIVMYSK